MARLQSVLEARPAIAARARVLEVGSEDDMTGILHKIPAEAVPVSVGGDGSVNRLVRSLRELGMGGRPIAVLPDEPHGFGCVAVGQGSLVGIDLGDGLVPHQG